MDRNPTENLQTVEVHRGQKRVFSEIALHVCTGSFRRAVVQCPGACHALYCFPKPDLIDDSSIWPLVARCEAIGHRKSAFFFFLTAITRQFDTSQETASLRINNNRTPGYEFKS